MKTYKVGMIGYGFMGKVHSHAFRSVNRFFPEVSPVEMSIICGRNETALSAAKDTYGWNAIETDWRKVVSNPEIDIIDICTAGDTHAEIAIEALKNGKHVLCEKPLANNESEAEAMHSAAVSAAKNGVFAMVAFNYRRVPALALAQQMIASGKLGQIYHVRANYLQDWIIDPEFPLVWRLDKSKAGSGALGDLGAHIIDAAQFVTGLKIKNVSGRLKTFITERPLPAEYTGLTAGAASGRGKVTVDDAADFTAEFENGAIGLFEATRFAAGRKNGMSLEVNGSKGSISFNFEDMNLLHFHDHTLPAAEAGFRRILATEGDQPYMAAWWPPGHLIGYEHTFTHEVRDFLVDIANKIQPQPSFTEGLYVQKVLGAVEKSSSNNSIITPI